MSHPPCRTVQLAYGSGRTFTCDFPVERLLFSFHAPLSPADFPAELARAIASPIQFPALARSVVPGDRVALALDGDAAESASIVAACWAEFAASGVTADDVTIVQPSGRDGSTPNDPRENLPDDIRTRIRRIVHDRDDKNASAYLASSANGERVYLARELLEADVVVSIGPLSFHPLLGYRGTHSVFFPALSNRDADERTRGQGHRELGPDDDRPMRQLVDEIGWLLGTQFTIQTIPAVNGGVARVLAGAADAVMKAGQRLLAEHWSIRAEERPEMIVVTVDSRTPGDSWEHFGAALNTAIDLVAHGGKIIVLTDLQEDPGEGMQLVRDCREPTDVIQTLRTAAPQDLLPATQLALAVDWADVYLFSGLDNDLVEELFMIPLEEPAEALRLLEGDCRCVFIESAHLVSARIDD